MSSPRTPPANPNLDSLIELASRLRAEDGCPWDREQTLRDVRAYLIEESHEVAAAIDDENWSDIGEELGDLLFQIAFILCLGREQGTLDRSEVITGLYQKMIDRHPHVFGNEDLQDSEAVRRAWERRKVEAPNRRLLTGVPNSLPSLVGAYRMSQKAAAVGFDWPNRSGVLAKVEEELTELQEEVDAPEVDMDRVRDELGDLLFAVANLSRHLQVDPEAALAQTNAKFRRRFAYIEEQLESSGELLGEAGLDRMEALWIDAKDQGL